MKHLRILLTLIVCIVVGCSLYAGVKTADGKRRVKARHYYYEALRHEAMGQSDAAYELYRRAHSIDPDYTEAAANYGLYRLMMDLDTLQSPAEMNRSLELLRQRVDAFPGDYYENESYAFIAKLLDTVPETVRVLRRVDSLNPERTSTLISLAQAYAAMYDYPNAIAALDSFERREGPNLEVATGKMSMRLSIFDTIGALADADRLIEMNPGNPQYLLVKGQLYQVIDRPDSAIALFKRAESLDTTDYQAKYALAEAYLQQGDSVNYDRKTYEVLLNNNLEMEQKVEILAIYLQMLVSDNQDTARGDHLFQVLTDQYPYEAEVLDLSARYNAAKGNPQLAIENISYALDQDRSNLNYWGQLMTYQIQADRAQDAMKTYHEATRHLETDKGLEVLYAVAAQMNKDYDTVVNVYTKIIHEYVPEINVNDTVNVWDFHNLSYEDLSAVSNAYTSIGDAYYQAGDTLAGFRAYDNAIALVPDNSLALNNYAYFLALSGKDLDKALEMSEKANEIAPGSATTMDTYAWILFLKREYRKALEYQKAAVEIAEKEGISSADLYLHYGDILFMNGEPDEAVKNWKKALETNKNDDLSEKEVRLLRKKIEHKAFFYD